MAAVVGTAGLWPAGAAAQPAAIARPAQPARPAGVARQVSPVSALASPSRTVRPAGSQSQLDAVEVVAAKPVRLTPRQIALRLLPRFGWSKRQFRYLDVLWAHESNWNKHAENPYSGAYGIPQAVPGSKMATAGGHWRNSARTQILWGLHYIKGRYGSPAAAWDHELATGWY